MHLIQDWAAEVGDRFGRGVVEDDGWDKTVFERFEP
jgi:hypothetical protein